MLEAAWGGSGRARRDRTGLTRRHMRTKWSTLLSTTHTHQLEHVGWGVWRGRNAKQQKVCTWAQVHYFRATELRPECSAPVFIPGAQKRDAGRPELLGRLGPTPMGIGCGGEGGGERGKEKEQDWIRRRRHDVIRIMLRHKQPPKNTKVQRRFERRCMDARVHSV